MNTNVKIENLETDMKSYLDFIGMDLNSSRITFCEPTLCEKVVEKPTEFITKNHAMFSIFPDDENPEDIRIEILPDFVWNKEDVWELVAELLENVGSIDKKGNIIDKNDPVFLEADRFILKEASYY